MKFNDITITKTPAQAARRALRKESIVVENISGRRLREELAKVKTEIDTLASRSGVNYARAVLHKEIYEEMARVNPLTEAEIEDADIEQAEVVIAARGMNKKFQDMIEDVADMLGSDMIALVDQIKQRFGDGAGEQYATTVKTALEGAIDTLTQTKDSLDSAISSLQSGQSEIMPPEGEENNAPIFPSSTGPESEPTGREIKSEVE